MPQFIVSYIGSPDPMSPEEQQQHMANYKQWLASLGAAAVSPMNPFMNIRTVQADGSIVDESTTGMTGFTMLECSDLDAALVLAQGCPFLSVGGRLEVAELVKMG